MLKRLKRLKGEACGDRFIKATRLSRLQEGDAGIGFSRLQGYQGYRRGMLRYVSQGYKAIKATGGGHRERSLKATRLSRLQGLDTLVCLRTQSLHPPPVALITL